MTTPELAVPIVSALATVPTKVFSGKASRVIVAFCPVLIFEISISFTDVLTVRSEKLPITSIVELVFVDVLEEFVLLFPEEAVTLLPAATERFAIVPPMGAVTMESCVA